jgi:glucosamine--fructose-6-phosphate aminotransferase (isomerizing)
MVSDAVKEVAIFKAHKSIPLVITDEGETRFDPYAAGTIRVPRAGGLSYLLATMVAHLFGYYAAARFDHYAERLRAVRAEVLTAADSPDGLAPAAVSPALTEKLRDFESTLVSGELDSGLESGSAARLSRAIHVLLGWLPVDVFTRHSAALADGVVAGISDAIRDLSRPIDAIKHQAKTVTVGISRGEAPATEGPLFEMLRGFGLAESAIAETHRRLLAALDPLVASVDGATLYQLEHLDPLGRPIPQSTIRVVKKTGEASAIASRSERERPLAGTKWGVVKSGSVYVGYGKNDGRRILILPVVGESGEGHLLLYHLHLVPKGRRDARLKALRAQADLLDRIQIAVTERNVPWDDALIEGVDNDTLFFETPDTVAERLLQQR